MVHPGFDQCGPSYAVFGNPILDGALHPMLMGQRLRSSPPPSHICRSSRRRWRSASREPRSSTANNQMPHQAVHADLPSPWPRTIIVDAVTLSSSEDSAISARHEKGIIFSKKSSRIVLHTPVMRGGSPGGGSGGVRVLEICSGSGIFGNSTI